MNLLKNSFYLFAMGLLLQSCSSSSQKPVTAVSELKPEERVIVGEIVFKGKTLSDFGPPLAMHSHGIIVKSNLALAKPDEFSIPISETGGPIRAKVSGDAILSDISTSASTLGVRGTINWPISIRIGATNDKCVYIGTVEFEFRKTGNFGVTPERIARNWRLIPHVRDEFDANKAALESQIADCKLVRSLAIATTGSNSKKVRAK